MPARQSTLSGASSPFSVANLGFTAFSSSGGTDPFNQSLTDAANNTYDVSVRYGNGQATIEEYQAAIAAELALYQQQAQSGDSTVSGPAQKKVIELTNLSRDAQNQADEVVANAAGPDALLAQYQKELGTMDPNSTAAIGLQKKITDLTKSISDNQQQENQQLASFNLATVTAAYNQGAATDDQYLAAYKSYAGTLKPDTAEYVNAQDNVVDLTYKIARNKISSAVDAGTQNVSDLLAFDKSHLAGMEQGSKGYADALTNYQSSESAQYQQDENKIVASYNASQLTATAALAFYQKQLTIYGDNPTLLTSIQSRVNDFSTRIQSDKDAAATTAFNDGKMSPAAYKAYSQARMATVAPGTPDYAKWSAEASRATDSSTESGLVGRYTLSTQYDDLQKFIADNSKAPGGTKTTTTQVYAGNGQWRTVTATSATPPTPDEQAAWAKTQIAVADAKQQLAGVGAQLNALGGYVSPQQMISFYQGLQAPLVKGTTQWWTYQNAIDGYTSKLHADTVLSAQGVKVGFTGQDGGSSGAGTSAPSAGGGGNGVSIGGGASGGSGGSGAGVAAPHGGPTSGGAVAGPAAAGSRDAAASAFLKSIGAPDTVGNRQAVQTIVYAEGPITGNNPFNIHGTGDTGTSRYAGVDDKNVGIYSSEAAGWAAGAQNLLHQGSYGSVIDAFKANNPSAVLDAWAHSPWASSGYGLNHKVNGQWVPDPNGSNTLYSTWAAHFGSNVPSSGGAEAVPGPSGSGGAKPAASTGAGATGSGAGATIGVSAKPTAFSIPPNMDAAQFQKLYSAATSAYRSGKTVFVDPNTQRVYNLPATAQARLDFINHLDDLNINLATERLNAAQATGDPAFIDAVSGTVTTRSAQLSAAVASSGENQMWLLSQQTKGATGHTITGAEAAKIKATGSIGGIADALHPQVNETSLTPLANGQRLTDQLVASIKTQGAAMQAELTAGHITAAYADYTRIIAMSSQSGGIVAQLQAYGRTADADIAKIQGKTPVGLVGTNASDIAALDNAATTIAKAAAPFADLYNKDIKPFVVTDKNGNVVPDKTGSTNATDSVMLRPGVVLYADRAADGSIKVTPQDIGGRVAGIAGKDPTRELTSIPDGRGGFIQVYAPFTVQQVGTITDSAGTKWPLMGKVEGLSAPGQAWVQDPTTGKWVQGPISIAAPNMKASPAIDANGNSMVDKEGQPVYQFSITAPAGATDAQGNQIGGQTFVLKADPATGIYTLVTTSPDGKTLVSPGTLQAGWSQALGVKIDTSAMTPAQSAEWNTPGNTMAWPGTDPATMQLAINGMSADAANRRMLGNAMTGIAAVFRAAGFGNPFAPGQTQEPSLPGGPAANRGAGAGAAGFGVEGQGLLPQAPPSPWANAYTQPSDYGTGQADPTSWAGGPNMPAPLAPPAAAVSPAYQPLFAGAPDPTAPAPGPAPLPPAPTPAWQGPVQPAPPPLANIGQGAGSSGGAVHSEATIGLPGKAPVATNPSSTASASIGVGAGATGSRAPTVPNQPVQHQQLPGGGVQGTATIPPIKAPTPTPIKSGPNRAE